MKLGGGYSGFRCALIGNLVACVMVLRFGVADEAETFVGIAYILSPAKQALGVSVIGGYRSLGVNFDARRSRQSGKGVIASGTASVPYS